MTHPPAGRSARLRLLTAHAHVRAEDTPFARDLASGQVSARAYTDYLGALLPIYRALEDGSARSTHPAVRAQHDVRLARTAALEWDLEAWTARSGGAGPRESATAAAYARRLDALAEESSPVLLAHHYVRYLGDLSGGQVVGAALRRAHGLGSEDGLELYRFPAPAPVLRADWRDRFDRALLSPDEETALGQEAVDAFALHGDLFAELHAHRS